LATTLYVFTHLQQICDPIIFIVVEFFLPWNVGRKLELFRSKFELFSSKFEMIRSNTEVCVRNWSNCDLCLSKFERCGQNWNFFDLKFEQFSSKIKVLLPQFELFGPNSDLWSQCNYSVLKVWFLRSKKPTFKFKKRIFDFSFELFWAKNFRTFLSKKIRTSFQLCHDSTKKMFQSRQYEWKESHSLATSVITFGRKTFGRPTFGRHDHYKNRLLVQ